MFCFKLLRHFTLNFCGIISPIDSADGIDRSGLPGGDETGEDAEDDGYEHAGKMTGIHLNVMSPSLRPQVPPATIDRTVPEPYTV